MRIALVAYSLEDYALEYANALSPHCEVTLYASRQRMESRAAQANSALRLKLLDWPRLRSPRIVRFVGTLSSLLRADAPDIIHNLSPTFFWFGILARRIGRSTTITTLHDVVNHPGDTRSAQVPVPAVRWGVRQSHALIVHGEALARQAELQFPGHRGRIHILPIVAPDRYRDVVSARGLKPKRDHLLRILCFGRMLPYKGISDLVESAGVVARVRGNVCFVMAGEGPCLSAARAVAPREADFQWIDRFVDDEEVAQLFLDADIVALPYIEASQSGVLSLAATFGKPVVATRVGSLPEVVGPSQMGLLANPGEPDDLARALLELAGNPAKRAEMGRNARQLAETTLSPTAVARRAMRICQATNGYSR